MLRKMPLIVTAALFFAAAPAEELFPRSFWKLTPEAEKLMREYAEAGKNYHSRTPRTLLFTRAQLKYTLSRSDYLHRWYDRPLLQNTALAKFDRRGEMVNPECAKLLKKTALELGMLDGIAFFPGTTGRESFFKSSAEANIPILPELENDALDKSKKYAETALRSPNAFRLGGKVVLTCYPVARNVEDVRRFRTELIKTCGDNFILMPYLNFLPPDLTPKPGQPTDVKTLRAIEANIRAILRESDGFYVGDNPLIWDRRVQLEFGEKVILPMLHKIFSEPEFQHKYLGYHWQQGHENSYRWSYSIDSEGTATLRKTGDFLLKLRPDFCILPEWDEENENTGYRPTVDTGFAAMRLIRCYASQFRGIAPTPFPGDDLDVPDLILSYRKQLLAGETAEFQLTNVPDGVKRDYKAVLTLTDLSGKVVHRFAPLGFSSEKCAAVSFKIPAAKLLKHQAVTPQLEISWTDGFYRADAGFRPLEVRANWIAEWRWVKQPLRELLSGIKGELSVTPEKDGMLRVRGKFSSPSPVAQLELLEGVDTVWMASEKAALRETSSQIVIDMTTFSLTAHPISGKISLLNAPSARSESGEALPFVLRGTYCSVWPRRFVAVLPRAEAEKAEIQIDIPPVFQQTIPVRELLARKVIALSGPDGESLVLSRYATVREIPEPGNFRETEIDCLIHPRDAKSLFSLRAIDARGHIWHGAPLSLRRNAGRTVSVPFYDRETRKTLTLTADASLFTQHCFDFAPGAGAVVPNSAGRKYWGILNGYVPGVTGFGSGESGYGSLPAGMGVCAKMKTIFVPKRLKEPEGFWSLEFRDGGHLSLPLQLVPYYTGFKMSMKIFVSDYFPEKQTIWSSGPNGCALWVQDGEVNASCFSDQGFFATERGTLYASSPGILTPGKWHTVIFERNAREFFVSVDGIKGKPTPFTGSILRHMAGCIGLGHPGKPFRGKIADLRVEIGK